MVEQDISNGQNSSTILYLEMPILSLKQLPTAN